MADDTVTGQMARLARGVSAVAVVEAELAARDALAGGGARPGGKLRAVVG